MIGKHACHDPRKDLVIPVFSREEGRAEGTPPRQITPEEFAQTETFSSRSPAVPYYVMHKLLAGLLSLHDCLEFNPRRTMQRGWPRKSGGGSTIRRTRKP